MSDEKKLLKSIPIDSSSFTGQARLYSSADSSSGSNNTSSKRRTLPPIPTRTKERARKALVLVVIILVLGLFMIPFVIHVFQVVDNSKTSQFDVGKCEEISWASNESMCSKTSEEYTGENCKNFLHTWQDCAISEQQLKVFVNVNRQLEKYVSQIIKFLDQEGSKKCKSAGIPFLCQYVYSLCDIESGKAFLPSQEECHYVTTVACTEELALVSSMIPDCDNFLSQTHPSNKTDIIPINISNLSDITCAEQFYEDNSTCLPNCAKFSQNTESILIWMETIEITTSWFGLIMSIIVLVLSAVRYKTMRKFPSVFLVYMTASFAIIVLFAAITFFDRSGLYCKSENLLYSIFNPTLFCTISGLRAAFHYCIVNATLWWFFHVSVIFYKLIFPLKALQTEKYEKYIHICLVILGLVAPLPAVVYTLVKSRYVLAQFPPLLCSPEGHYIWYYSTILVLNVLVGAGVCMFIPMFWIIHKNRGVAYRKGAMSIAEKKIVFALCYYVLFGVSSLCYFGITSWDQNKFIYALIEYFDCQLPGNGQQCDHHYRKYTNPEIKGITYIIMSMVPIANLAFVINWKKVGVFTTHCKNILSNIRARDGQNELSDVHSVFSPQPESEDNNN